MFMGLAEAIIACAGIVFCILAARAGVNDDWGLSRTARQLLDEVWGILTLVDPGDAARVLAITGVMLLICTIVVWRSM